MRILPLILSFLIIVLTIFGIFNYFKVLAKNYTIKKIFKSIILNDGDVIFYINDNKCTIYYNFVGTRRDAVEDYQYFINKHIKQFDIMRDKPIIINFADGSDKRVCTFSSCSKESILIPDPYSFSTNVLFNIIDSRFISYRDKLPMALWRGSSTGGINFNNSRGKLCKLSNEYPMILDAKITNWCDGISMINEYVGNYMNISSQLRYKILIDIDGNSNAWSSLAWKLYSGSIVLKVVSETKQWYYDKLIAYENYVPVRNDLSNLIDQIHWIFEHDDECEKIVYNSRLLAKEVFEENSLVESILEGMKKFFTS